ncbi:hypothetical protein QBC36DRAFT_381254 [Triangularia setosa]|uniref:Uncharacterized protein n=1 Tax=Triangularia setosa TaxID=2587417 RepID=A0AAN7A5F2_9PEZI|nr:hypothetical protein QBC36DRAFT_381254 [Podospora setosa]
MWHPSVGTAFLLGLATASVALAAPPTAPTGKAMRLFITQLLITLVVTLERKVASRAASTTETDSTATGSITAESAASLALTSTSLSTAPTSTAGGVYKIIYDEEYYSGDLSAIGASTFEICINRSFYMKKQPNELVIADDVATAISPPVWAVLRCIRFQTPKSIDRPSETSPHPTMQRSTMPRYKAVSLFLKMLHPQVTLENSALVSITCSEGSVVVEASTIAVQQLIMNTRSTRELYTLNCSGTGNASTAPPISSSSATPGSPLSPGVFALYKALKEAVNQALYPSNEIGQEALGSKLREWGMEPPSLLADHSLMKAVGACPPTRTSGVPTKRSLSRYKWLLERLGWDDLTNFACDDLVAEIIGGLNNAAATKYNFNYAWRVTYPATNNQKFPTQFLMKRLDVPEAIDGFSVLPPVSQEHAAWAPIPTTTPQPLSRADIFAVKLLHQRGEHSAAGCDSQHSGSLIDHYEPADILVLRRLKVNGSAHVHGYTSGYTSGYQRLSNPSANPLVENSVWYLSCDGTLYAFTSQGMDAMGGPPREGCWVNLASLYRGLKCDFRAFAIATCVKEEATKTLDCTPGMSGDVMRANTPAFAVSSLNRNSTTGFVDERVNSLS